MSKPRIYVAISTFFPLIGGAEIQTHALCKQLCERGYEATIITFRHKNAWLPYEVIGGVPVLRIAGFLLGKREKLPRFLRRLLYLLAMLQMSLLLWRHQKNYDVLQVCQFNLLVLPLAFLCRLSHKLMVIRVTSAGAERPTKTRNKATLVAGPIDPTTSWLQVDGQTWVDGDLYGLERAGKLVVGCLRSLLKRIEVVVVVLSSRMSTYLARHDFRLPDTQIIPNGVDITRFCPLLDNDEYLQNDRAQVVVCVSKMRYEKGVDVLLQAWRLVHERAPHARLIIVGNGPLQAQLERMADALGIVSSVEFAGLQKDVPAQLYRGSIGVLPSRWEGMPNALLEAMACGLPCVATAVSGSEDIIQNEYNGLLVEPEDFESMAHALLTLLDNPKIIQNYGYAARETIEKFYALDHITNKYIELYEKPTIHVEQVVNATQQSKNHQLMS